jgi:hypothetical protein
MPSNTINPTHLPPSVPVLALQVFEHEKYFVFEHQPGGLEWRVLGEACAELDKLAALLEGKLKVGAGLVEAATWALAEWRQPHGCWGLRGRVLGWWGWG